MAYESKSTMSAEQALSLLRSDTSIGEFARFQIAKALEDKIEQLHGANTRNKSKFIALQERAKVLQKDCTLYKGRSDTLWKRVRDLELRGQALGPDPTDIYSRLFGKK